MSFLKTLEDRPRDAVYLFILAQLVIWTAVPYSIAISLPLDVVSDGLAWGHEWQWGYFKHPPLPSWLVEIFFDGLGDIGPFLLSQVAIAITCLFVFALGREMMSERKAAFGTILLAGVYYFSVPSAEWNHNVAQMPAWAAMAYLFYRALKTDSPRWWLLLGIAAGIGLMMKYSTAVLMAVMLLYLLSGRDLRARFLTAGPYFALAACIATISPHLVWLVQNNFPSLHYAASRAGHDSGIAARILLPLKFLASQAIDLVPALLLAAVAGLFGRGMTRTAEWKTDKDLHYLLAMGIGPALFTAVLSLVAGLGLRAMWGAPMWNLTGLIVVALAGLRADRASFGRLGLGAVVLLIVMPLLFWFTTSFGPQQRGHIARSAWPDKAMARNFQDVWFQQTGRPISIVAGDGWLAGLIAMRVNPRASVLADGNMHMSPWVTPARLADEGALVVWRLGKTDAPPPGLAALPHFKSMGIMQFSWPRAHKAPLLTLGWGMVPPRR